MKTKSLQAIMGVYFGNKGVAPLATFTLLLAAALCCPAAWAQQPPAEPAAQLSVPAEDDASVANAASNESTANSSIADYRDEVTGLSFQDVGLRAVLQVLADYYGFNLVVSAAVSGDITLRLDNVPWHQALEMVLRTGNLAGRLEGNILYVAPAAEIAARENAALQATRRAQAMAPLYTEFIQINYADATALLELISGSSARSRGEVELSGDAVLPLLMSGPGGVQGIGGAMADSIRGSSQVSGGVTGSSPDMGSDDAPSPGSVSATSGDVVSGDIADGILSPRGSARVDVRTNILIVRDRAEKLQEIRALTARLDIPVRQVLIEARIVNVSTDYGRDLGIRWGGGGSRGGGRFSYGGSLETSSRIGQESAQQDGVPLLADLATLPEALAVDLGVTRPGASSFAIGYTGNSGLIELELSALESSGSGEVIARPKVTTQDKTTALIQSGVRIPYQSQAGGTAGGSTTEFEEALLSLEVTPQITPDGRIDMMLDIRQDSVAAGPAAVPAINTNQVTTSALVDDGATIVLGGVFREESVSTETKTPFLSDIPALGRLFKRTETTSRRTELLVFITPTIVDGI